MGPRWTRRPAARATCGASLMWSTRAVCRRRPRRRHCPASPCKVLFVPRANITPTLPKIASQDMQCPNRHCRCPALPCKTILTCDVLRTAALTPAATPLTCNKPLRQCPLPTETRVLAVCMVVCMESEWASQRIEVPCCRRGHRQRRGINLAHPHICTPTHIALDGFQCCLMSMIVLAAGSPMPQPRPQASSGTAQSSSCCAADSSTASQGGHASALA